MMPEKAIKIITISMDPALLDQLDAVVEKGKRSKILCDLVKQFVNNKVSNKKVTIVEHNPDSVPIVIKVPSNLKGDRQGLQDWLTVKLHAIVNALS